MYVCAGLSGDTALFINPWSCRTGQTSIQAGSRFDVEPRGLLNPTLENTSPKPETYTCHSAQIPGSPIASLATQF